VRPGVIKINKAGWLYILVTILIGFSAVYTGNNLVYIIISALLSYLLVSGVFGNRNLYGVDAELILPEDIFAQTETLAEVRIRNGRKWLPVFLITVGVCEGESFFPYIAAGSTVSGILPLKFEKRGTEGVSEIVVSSNFPFDFFRRFRKIRKKAVITVYPKALRCDLTPFQDRGTWLKGEKELNKPGYDSDIISIRDYVHGDPPKYISWKSTAKTGSLKVKELSAIERQQVTIDFDHMEKVDLERALSCTVFAVISLLRLKIPVGLRIGGEVLKPGLSAAHRRTVLTRLALYGES
jgi:uncharacterized protein (DUF58 family)